MSLYGQIVKGLRVLTRRQTTDSDISEEVNSYFDEAVAARVSEGIPLGEARRLTRLDFGNTTSVREQVRSYGWENSLEAALISLRYALRRLAKAPWFTTTTIAMLAVGLGASTAMFCIIDGVLFKPLPYPHSEQLITLRHSAPGVNIAELNMAPSLYFTYMEENRVFQDLALWSTSTSTITGTGEPDEVPVLMVTHQLLPMLEVGPESGRRFAIADDGAKSRPAAMLSDGYWRSHFGGDQSIIGRRILVDGKATEVIGVLPPSFRFMDQNPSLVMPLQFDRANVRLIDFSYEGVARLKPGVTIKGANADVARMIAIAPAKFPPNPGVDPKAFAAARITPNLLPLKDSLVGDTGNMLWVLMGTVVAVLFIACANVANLSILRAEARQQELAVRASLGAEWGRILRELLTESIVLCAAGTVFGLALAFAAVRIFKASDFIDLPRLSDVSIDTRVLLFALGIAFLSALLCGLIPAIKYARPQLSSALKSGGRGLSESKERHRARSILVVVQVALALVLLVSSGLMIRTFLALHHVDPGFSKAKQIQTISISIPESQAKEPERVLQTHEDLLRHLAALPGVLSVAITNTVPMDGGSNDTVYAEDKLYRQGTLPPIARYKFISPGYVSTIGSRLIAGRDLTWSETDAAAPVALISENFARELWHEPRAALGKRIRPNTEDAWREIVGVVADLHDKGVDQQAPSIAYWLLLQRNFEAKPVELQRNVAFVIRAARTGSAAFVEEVRRAVWLVNPSLPVANVRTLQSIYDRSLARTSLSLVLLLIAAAVALLLGLIGTYGVISYAVSQRTREIGIRLALGSPLHQVTTMFVRQGLQLSAIGVAAGALLAGTLTHLLNALLFNVSPADPLTYLLVSTGLLGAVILASYLPARRATKVRPIDALRADS